MFKLKLLSKSGWDLNPSIYEKPSALTNSAFMFTVIISKSYQSSDPPVSPGTKFLSNYRNYTSMYFNHGIGTRSIMKIVWQYIE